MKTGKPVNGLLGAGQTKEAPLAYLAGLPIFQLAD